MVAVGQATASTSSSGREASFEATRLWATQDSQDRVTNTCHVYETPSTKKLTDVASSCELDTQRSRTRISARSVQKTWSVRPDMTVRHKGIGSTDFLSVSHPDRTPLASMFFLLLRLSDIHAHRLGAHIVKRDSPPCT